MSHENQQMDVMRVIEVLTMGSAYLIMANHEFIENKNIGQYMQNLNTVAGYIKAAMEILDKVITSEKQTKKQRKTSAEIFCKKFWDHIIGRN